LDEDGAVRHYGKVGVRSRTQGARWACRHGLAEPVVDRENPDSTEDRVYLDGPARSLSALGPRPGSMKARSMPRDRGAATSPDRAVR
jgi:hypothetical protein